MHQQETKQSKEFRNHEYTKIPAQKIQQKEFQKLIQKKELTCSEFFNICKYVVDKQQYNILMKNKQKFCCPKIKLETEDNVSKPLIIFQHIIETLCSLVFAKEQNQNQLLKEEVHELEQIFRNSDEEFAYQTLIDFQIRGRKENARQTQTQFNNILGVIAQLKTLQVQHDKKGKNSSKNRVEQNNQIKSNEKQIKVHEKQIKKAQAKDPRGSIFERVDKNKCKTELSILYERERRNLERKLLYFGK